MAKMTADLRQRKTLRQQVRGARVAQPVRTGARRRYSKLTGSSFDDPVQSAMAKGSMGSSEPEKQLRVRSSGAYILYIASDDICQRIDQGAKPCLALFSAWDGQSSFVPVQILQPDPFHLTRPKPIDSKQQKDSAVAYIRFTVCFGTRQQALNVGP
jgi:hypothetical protein